jgi:hypothetical protein
VVIFFHRPDQDFRSALMRNLICKRLNFHAYVDVESFTYILGFSGLMAPEYFNVNRLIRLSLTTI